MSLYQVNHMGKKIYSIGLHREVLQRLAQKRRGCVCVLQHLGHSFYWYPDIDQTIKIPDWWGNLSVFGKWLGEVTQKTIGW